MTVWNASAAGTVAVGGTVAATARTAVTGALPYGGEALAYILVAVVPPPASVTIQPVVRVRYTYPAPVLNAYGRRVWP